VTTLTTTRRGSPGELKRRRDVDEGGREAASAGPGSSQDCVRLEKLCQSMQDCRRLACVALPATGGRGDGIGEFPGWGERWGIGHLDGGPSSRGGKMRDDRRACKRPMCSW